MEGYNMRCLLIDDLRNNMILGEVIARTYTEGIKQLELELEKYSDELSNRERWLVLNKQDMLPQDQCDELNQKIIDKLQWKGPVYFISAVTRAGTDKLCEDIMSGMEREVELKHHADEEQKRKQELENSKEQMEAANEVQAGKDATTDD